MTWMITDILQMPTNGQKKLQQRLLPELCKMIEPAGKYLHECGYVGVVGIDILQDGSNNMFLVDVNPRLTGITPFLMASRIFAREGLNEGFRFNNPNERDRCGCGESFRV